MQLMIGPTDLNGLQMDSIYIAPLSKALNTMPLIHSHTHTYLDTDGSKIPFEVLA